MVVLSPKFTILASMSVLAVMSMLPTSDAIAIHNERHNGKQREVAQNRHGVNGGTSRSPDVQGSDAPASATPQPAGVIPELPLPGLSRKDVGSDDDAAGAYRLAERWDPTDPVVQLGEFWLGSKPPHRRADHDRIDVEGDNDHVHVSKHHRTHGHVVVSGDDDHVHIHRRSPSPDPRHHHHHYYHDHDKVVVSGNDDSVDVHMKREPRRHHHHHDKVIVSGDHDHVNVHEKRAPRRKYRHHFHGHRRSLSAFDSYPRRDSGVPLLDKDTSILVPSLSRRSERHHHHHGSDTLVVSGDHDDVKANMKRQMSAFSEPEGVPGTVDIMSATAGSSQGQRIASLVLATVNGTGEEASQFVLNASETNQTQIYMVALPDDFDSPAQGSDNSTYPADPITSGNSTSPDPASSSAASSSAMSLVAEASSNSTMPSDSTAPSNSTSPEASSDTPPYKKVALKIPVFDPDTATMEPYCATFDPQPMAPSPLTVESCSGGPTTAEHKSQVFAYDPSTGVVQPLWYAGDGDNDGIPGDDGTDGDDGEDDGTHAPAGNSSVAEAGASPADTDATMARIANLSDKLINSRAKTPQSFAAQPAYSGAQNVTLVFTPTTPMVAAQHGSEKLENTSSSSVSSSTASTSSTMSPASSVVTSSAAPTSTTSSTTASDSYTTTMVTFSPAAVEPTPTSSVTDTVFSSDFVSTTVTFSAAEATPTLSDSSMVSASFTSAAVSSTSLSSDAVSSTSAAHSLNVEVFDPNATPAPSSDIAGSSATSTSDSFGSQSLSDSSASATMTPVSTAPYEWMFREGLAKNKSS